MADNKSSTKNLLRKSGRPALEVLDINLANQYRQANQAFSPIAEVPTPATESTPHLNQTNSNSQSLSPFYNQLSHAAVPTQNFNNSSHALLTPSDSCNSSLNAGTNNNDSSSLSSSTNIINTSNKPLIQTPHFNTNQPQTPSAIRKFFGKIMHASKPANASDEMRDCASGSSSSIENHQHNASNDLLAQDVHANCADVEIKSDSSKSSLRKQYAAYKVIVAIDQEHSYFIFRRYTEFESLYSELRKSHPHLEAKLPPKRMFGNFDHDFLEQRKAALGKFLQMILSEESLRASEHVRRFLQLDQHIEELRKLQELSKNNDTRDDASSKASSDQNISLGVTETKSLSPEDFTFLKVIGKGNFGKVYLARKKQDFSNKAYAIKVLDKSRVTRSARDTRHVMSERNILVKNMHHPFLVALRYSFRTREKLYFVMDYINGGELFFHLQRVKYFSEERARFYSAEIASAIGYLHEHGVIYRDLKPENLLLDADGHIKLTDFGLCKEGLVEEERTSTYCGTPEYIAPELIKRGQYGLELDWWCLGAVTYEMLTGLPPWYRKDQREMHDAILTRPLPLHKIATDNARSLVSSLLQKDPEMRLGRKRDFQEIKEHRFFCCIDWEALERRELQPPYIPKVVSDDDVRNIDPEFRAEQISESVVRSGNMVKVRNGNYFRTVSAAVEEPDDDFRGFSYAAPIQWDDHRE